MNRTKKLVLNVASLFMVIQINCIAMIVQKI